MSYSTWHNYGYGIRVDDIKEQSVERALPRFYSRSLRRRKAYV